ncbi:MAG TPA: hypothetical protein PK867_17135 [Pirellulales bacterium]|nr:hypothetical protein [Pirellulales bacterium]
MIPDYEDYRWLVGDAAGHALARLASCSGDLLREASRLRREHSTGRVHLLLEQVELRRRGRGKFADADRMFFTSLGLEQATDQWTAAYKALRFRRCETGPVWDLCCGIGGDLSALARGREVVGVERDRVKALLARANCRTLADRAAAQIVVADAGRLPAEPALWHIDPDRRSAGRRTTRVERCQPGVDVLDRLRRSSATGAVKLAPAGHVPDDWRQQAELEWVSRDGECKQLVAWFGELASAPGMRRATVVVGRGLPPRIRTFVGRPDGAPAVAADFGRYLAEPDAAVLAAGLVGTLAAEHELSAVAAGAVYLTGDRAVDDPALDWFEICEALPFDIKHVKAVLRGRQIGRLEIKKRGVDVVPEQLHRRLCVPGDESATLFLVRRGETVSAVLSRRVGIKDSAKS